MQLWGRYLYVTRAEREVVVLDVNDPTNLVKTPLSRPSGRVGDTVYAGGPGVLVIDVSDRTKPTKLGKYALLELRNIVVDSDNTLIGVHRTYIYAIPSGTPYERITARQRPSTSDGPGDSWAIAARGGRVYVGGKNAMHIYYKYDDNRYQLSELGLVGKYENTALGELFAATLSGEVLFVVGTSGVFALDVSVDTAPKLLGAFR
eukprot:Sspe_Gene.47767::Locus_24517_Transcript_2_4_Confidence_0.800_Length_1186::g.47767::m.47767